MSGGSQGGGEDQPGDNESMPPWWWTSTGPATDSAYSSSDHDYPWPQPTRDTAGSRARAEEHREYRALIHRLGFREYGYGDTDQSGASNQSFFIAGAALHSMARGVFPDPDSCRYTLYPAGHPAWHHTAEGVRGQVQTWMRDDPQHYPPHEPRVGEGPGAMLSADDLQNRADQPGLTACCPS